MPGLLWGSAKLSSVSAFQFWLVEVCQSFVVGINNYKIYKTPALTFLWLVTLTFDPKINGFQGLIAEHFGDFSCIDFWNIVRKTDRGKNSTPASAVSVGKDNIAPSNDQLITSDRWRDNSIASRRRCCCFCRRCHRHHRVTDTTLEMCIGLEIPMGMGVPW